MVTHSDTEQKQDFNITGTLTRWSEKKEFEWDISLKAGIPYDTLLWSEVIWCLEIKVLLSKRRTGIITLSVHVKVKANLSLCFSWAPRHDFGAIWSWVVNFKPRMIYLQGKSHSCPLDRKLGGYEINDAALPALVLWSYTTGKSNI
jgi:hypothetical protein